MSGIVLFDGECNLCDKSVQFIMKRDKKGYFKFASLQSDIGQTLLQQHKVPATTDSIVFIENGTAYTKSTAALKIARKLDGACKLGYVAILIPKPVRNIIYTWIANNRYKWLGKKDACALPTPEQRKRFL